MAANEAEPPAPAERALPTWWPALAPVSESRAAKHRLTEEIRRLISDLYEVEADGCLPGELDEATAAVTGLRQRLAALPSARRHGSVSAAPGGDGVLFERSPFTGRSNPLAVPLILSPDEDRTRGHARYPAAYEGPVGTVHGGHVIAAFDDLLGVAQMASGAAGLTGTLTVRLNAPTPLHRRIEYEAGISAREGRKIFAWGRSTLDGILLAEATGIFIGRRPG